ncbi:MAG: cytochrome c [Gammaproteobacteria bacterium]|nr:cytochrome c [Gammaproteobacteria bacterium]
MANQPSIKPQEARVQAPPGAIPRTPRPPVLPPGPAGQARELAGNSLHNPQAADPASLARGERMYLRHCAACHGAGGRGDGLVGKKFQPRPADLTQAYVRGQADGRLYYTISRGSVVMPGYDLSLSGRDRWHLINYLKQGLGRE